MPVDRLSVTVPGELGTALRELAEHRGETVSTVVTDAIEREIRLATLREALTAATRKHGRLDEGRVRDADAELSAPRGRRRRPQ